MAKKIGINEIIDFSASLPIKGGVYHMSQNTLCHLLMEEYGITKEEALKIIKEKGLKELEVD